MCLYPNHKNLKQDAHDLEHQQWNRRSFLKALGLVGGGTMMIGGTNLTASKPTTLASAISNSDSDRILVLIRLKGGNDGLNTIVPIYDYDEYANLRPTLRHLKSNLYNLNSDFAIPNYMSELQSMWGEGAMKVIHGVGYDDSSLSHFVGSDIWASTDINNDTITGWMGRYFEEIYPDYLANPPEIPAAIQIGSIGNLIFQGDDSNYAFSVSNPDQLENIAQSGTLYNMENLPDCVYGDQLRFLRGTTNSTFQYSGTIHDAYTNSSNGVNYSDNLLGSQLAIVARMIKGNLGTKVYMVTLGGFDTHANQLENHQILLSNLSNSIKLFFDDLGLTGHDSNVLAMTFSEFGRRPYENGSAGTDHGTAAPLLLFGPALDDNGFVGTHPSLTDFNINGNLVHSLDFRQIYASVMQEWLCIDPNIVSEALLGESLAAVDLGISCNSLSNGVVEINAFKHYVFYQNYQTILQINNKYTQHTTVKVFNILGAEVGVIMNDLLTSGNHSININEKIKTRLSPGQYIYRISSGGTHYSKSFIVI